MVILIYVLSALTILVSARIEEDVMPEVLHDCYSRNHPTTATKHQVQTSCLNSYLSHLFGNKTYHGLDATTLAWVDSLGRELHIRLKRQSASGSRKGPRLRKEIRTLSDDEREEFFDAVNALKNDRIPSSPFNKYDAIAVLHQDQALPSAHNGYNFPSWHRYYLALFEEALRTKRSRVALPYWDSRIDFRMTNPADTIFFSEVFLGNGRGVVYTGPFAMWRTPSDNTYLRRDIPGPDSSLIDPVKIQDVLNKRYHREILSPTSASDDDNLERHHDGVHRWIGGVGGHMGGLDTSPMDPVFFLHHCFIDYLWEEFRKRQISLGINPETDYPTTTDPNHQPNNIMANLQPPKRNIDGYSNSFTRDIYSYADAPTCQNGCGNQNHFLYCDRGQNGCVSRTRNEFVQNDYFSRIKKLYVRGLKQTITDLVNTKINTRLQRLGGGVGGEGTGLTLEPPIDNVITAPAAAPQIIRRFVASIIDRRTRSLRTRRDVDVSRRKLNIDLNININLKQESLNTSSWRLDAYNFNNLATTPILITNIHQHGAGALHKEETFNITLQTDGFTYIGRHVDNVIIHERSISTDSIAYITFERPSIKADSIAYVTVYDSYGGVCMPSCLVDGSTYQDCSGVIKVTDDFPLMYLYSANVNPGDEIKPFLRFSCEN